MQTYGVGATLAPLSTRWIQMIITISEMYCNASRHDATFEHLDIKMKLSNFFLQLVLSACTTDNYAYMKSPLQFHPHILNLLDN
jgi:hypothetical protein